MDLDSQANMSMGFGYANPDEILIKLSDLLQAEISKRMGRQAHAGTFGNKDDFILKARGVDFIPSSLDLASLELVLMNTTAREFVTDSHMDYTHIFETCVPLSVEVSKQQSQGLPIMALKSNKVSAACSRFAEEVMKCGEVAGHE